MSAGVFIAVLLAGAVGALLRYGVSLAFARPSSLRLRSLSLRSLSLSKRSRSLSLSKRRPTTDFPRAVLVVNVIGSALSGALLALAQGRGLSADAFLILVTGLCGGLTTFSTWSVETMQLVIEGRMRVALSNVCLNLLLGLAAAALCYFAVLAVAGQ
ncbi:fluoride efflux transporter FluC [Parafrigoribacterium soli]|uniref:fluoride efflux transporter FluC n=1 Tax=Parafrigoribacterium soli TaxID=3144663 RepID=UPI0032EE7B3C